MSRTTLGISFKLGSVLLIVCMFALIKMVSEEVPTGQIMFFRSVFALPVILIWLVVRRELRTGLRMVRPMGHLWRGIIGTSAMGLSFAALGYLPLGQAQAIQYTAPLLVVIFAAVLLGERVRLFRIGAVFMGLIGVLIVLAPSLVSLKQGGLEAGQAFGAGLMLTSTVFAALAQIFVRKLVVTDETSSIVFWFSVIASLIALLTLPFGWVMLSLPALAMLIVIGVFGGLSLILLTTSYRLAEMSVVAPFEYASMLFALGFGYVLFDEVPALATLGGVSLIIAAGVLIIWREHALGIECAKARKAGPPQG